MKQAYRILFLLLTVGFSFGFTTSESACLVNKEDTHKCCQKSEKETVPNKCKGECCVQNTTISRFEEGIVLSIETQKTDVVGNKTPETHSIFYNLKSIERGLTFSKPQLKYFVLKTPKHTSRKTQVWLI